MAPSELKCSLLVELRQKNRLQSIQNFASKIVTNSRKFDHVTPLLRELNWFPGKEHIFYRDSVLTFKCQNDLAPQYLWASLPSAQIYVLVTLIRGTLGRFRYTEWLLASAHSPIEGPTYGITCLMNLGKVPHWHISSAPWKTHYWGRHFLHKL